jgi:accessory gene regulator B
MISKIAVAVSEWLVTQGAVTSKDKNLFSYAVYSLLFGMMPIFIIVILGLIFDMLSEGLLLVTPFMLLRKFSGGYHLKSSMVCTVTSTSLLTFSLLAVRIASTSNTTIILSVLVALSAITLFLLSPIDSEARRLSPKERKVFRLIARIITSIFLLIYFLLVLFDQTGIAAPIGIGIIIPAILQMPCLIQRLLSKCHTQNVVQ